MSRTMKSILMTFGALAAILIVSQLVMGLIILGGPGDVHQWVKRHQHSGYLTVVVSLIYIAGSMAAIASTPGRPRG